MGDFRSTAVAKRETIFQTEQCIITQLTLGKNLLLSETLIALYERMGKHFVLGVDLCVMMHRIHSI